MKPWLCVIVFGLLTRSSFGLYDSSDDVIQLTYKKFEKMTVSDELWLVEFYAPWCGHCKSLAPVWKKVATALKGIVKVGAVDVVAYENIGSQYGVQGFPTIKFFGADKTSPIDYEGGRDENSIIEETFRTLKEMVKKRMFGGRSDGRRDEDSSDGGSVIELTDETFDQIFKSDDLWLVEFFAPWCGHCKRLKPEWEKAAKELKGKVKVAAIDATTNKKYASMYNVNGFPTIKVFPAGAKSQDAEDYTGGRTASEIVSWAMDHYTAVQKAPELAELISSEVLDGACESNQICVISFLPVLLDCQAECRNGLLTMLRNISKKFARNGWGWLWVEATVQETLEKAFEIGGFGYPAMVAVNSRKKIFSVLKGSFSEEGINEFLMGLSYGRGSTAPLSGNAIPPVITTIPWDGNDAKSPVEEEIDLDDLGIKTDL